MAVRDKRSISLPPDLADAIDVAAEADGLSVSAWIARAARNRLRVEAGRQGILEWEAENGPLTADERAEGRALVRALIGRAEIPQEQAT